ncbi:MAG: glycosyltransferase family 9 protein [Jatrophihabitans sp.]|uniref:glycosyltransferase family 9 protein n=1 Tax=Jatrophihabitans sp. TaxID=1932789 RepID=UPI003F7DCD48
MSAAPVALVSRPLGLGDLVTGVPALRMLRAALPRHRLVLATARWLWPLAEHARLADALVEGHELTPLVDPPDAPDLAVDLHGNGPESRALLEATHPGRLLAFVGGPVQWRPDEHEVDRWCRLVREGLPTNTPAPPVTHVLGPPPATARAGATVVHCGAKAASRRWPVDRFAVVARALAADGHDVVITGSPAEAPIAAAVARAAGADALTSLDLLELAGLVGTARVVVSGDTGVGHLAGAYARPSVVLMGPVPPHRWGPPRHRRHQVLYRGTTDGDPHGASVDPALLRIEADDVLGAVSRALAREPART